MSRMIAILVLILYLLVLSLLVKILWISICKKIYKEFLISFVFWINFSLSNERLKGFLKFCEILLRNILFIFTKLIFIMPPFVISFLSVMNKLLLIFLVVFFIPLILFLWIFLVTCNIVDHVLISPILVKKYLFISLNIEWAVYDYLFISGWYCLASL